MWSKLWQRFIAFKALWLLLVAWRLWALVALWLGPKWLVWQPRFVAESDELGRDLPHWLTTWANFDGLHYLEVAKFGYNQYILPFFPLYPLLIRLVHTVTGGPWIVTGLIVSYLAFGLSLVVVYKLLKLDAFKPAFTWFCLLWLVFPTSAFYGAVYNDSVFFLLSCLTMYWARQAKWPLAVLAGALATLTRLNGLALAGFIGLEYVQSGLSVARTWEYPQWLTQVKRQVTLKKIIQTKVWLVALIPATLAGYLGYIQLTSGSWHLLFKAMDAWQQNSLTFPLVVFWRYFKIFLTISPNTSVFWVAMIEFLAICFYLGILAVSFKKIRLSYWVFIGVSILIPWLTGTFAGMPRYGLHLYPLFLAIALFIQGRPKPLQWCYILVCLLLSLIIFGLFAQGYFVT